MKQFQVSIRIKFFVQGNRKNSHKEISCWKSNRVYQMSVFHRNVPNRFSFLFHKMAKRQELSLKRRNQSTLLLQPGQPHLAILIAR
jgi:predicted site-specific integrase-resolvase